MSKRKLDQTGITQLFKEVSQTDRQSKEEEKAKTERENGKSQSICPYIPFQSYSCRQSFRSLGSFVIFSSFFPFADALFLLAPNSKLVSRKSKVKIRQKTLKSVWVKSKHWLTDSLAALGVLCSKTNEILLVSLIGIVFTKKRAQKEGIIKFMRKKMGGGNFSFIRGLRLF